MLLTSKTLYWCRHHSLIMETTIQKQIDDMGEYLFDRFMEFHKVEDVETCKVIMDEWVVDGADPDDGDVEFIWLDQIKD